MAIIPIPDGELGTVVTFLEMTSRPPLRPLPPSSLRMVRWPDPHPDKYRQLFRRVGARWLWYSRLAMSDDALVRQYGELHVVIDRAGIEVGMIELDFGTPGECLVRFLGLVPELAGKGHGSWLFAQLMAISWRGGIGRVHLTTCTLDHPAALPAYLKQGFRAYKRVFETFPDPRVRGLINRDAAQQQPLIG